MANNVVSVSEDGKLGKSDHCILTTEIKVQKLERKVKKKSPNWSKADYGGLRQHLANCDWDILMRDKPVEEASEILKK